MPTNYVTTIGDYYHPPATSGWVTIDTNTYPYNPAIFAPETAEQLMLKYISFLEPQLTPSYIFQQALISQYNQGTLELHLQRQLALQQLCGSGGIYNAPINNNSPQQSSAGLGAGQYGF